MRKNKLFASLITIPILSSSLIPLSSCKNSSQQFTIKFNAIDGVTLTGSTSIKVKQGTKWSDIIKPTAVFSETNLLADAGWFDEKNQQYMFRLPTDFEIESDMSVTYHIITENNSTLISFMDMKNTSVLFQHHILKGSSWKAVKSLFGGDITPQQITNYDFKYWTLDLDPISDDTIFDENSAKIKSKWEWIGPCVEFTHSAGVNWVGVPDEKIEIHEQMTWKDLVNAKRIPTPEYDTTLYGALGWIDANNKTQITEQTVIDSDFNARFCVYPKIDTDTSINVNFVEQFFNGDQIIKTVKHTLPFQQKTSQKSLSLADFIIFYEFANNGNINFKKTDINTDIYNDAECSNRIDPNTTYFELSKEEGANTFYLKLNLKEFCTDSWQNVVTQADKGLDNLLQHYGEKSLIGLERVIELFHHKCKVRVIGQNHDLLNNRKNKAALTFELVELVSASEVPGNTTYLTPLTTPLSWDDTGYMAGKNIDHVLNQSSGTVCWYENGSATPSTRFNKSCLYMGQNSSDEGTNYLFNHLKTVRREFDKIYKWQMGQTVEYAYHRAAYNTKLFVPNFNEISTEQCYHPIGTRYEYYSKLQRKDFGKKYLDSFLQTMGYDLISGTQLKPEYWTFQSDGWVEDEREWKDKNIAIAINENGNKHRIECTNTKQIGVSFCFCI